ncbi:beta-propeller domain-containing protein [Candidatus Woesearchaeota archaeon]|nr:beta-propeller domain-containing protein [Candidatus Woesearchaeota archaeon]
MKKLILLLFVVLMTATACTTNPGSNLPSSPFTPSGTTTGEGPVAFTSLQELQQYLQASQANTNQYYSSGIRRGGIRILDTAQMAVAPAPNAASDMAESGKVSGTSASNVDFSTTNIQVAGVDEADIIKTDGSFIYLINQNQLTIVDAQPAAETKVIATLPFTGTPRDLFINDGKLVLFLESYEQKLIFPEYSPLPYPSYQQNTEVLVFDIGNKEKPRLINNVSLEGSYFQARMIGNVVYWVTQQNVYSGPIIHEPLMKMETGRTGRVFSPTVYHFRNPEQNYIFNTVASLNLDNENVNAETYLLGYGNTLYVSQDNLYITYQKQVYDENEQKKQFEEVLLPLLPSEVAAKVRAASVWNEKAVALEEFYNSMTEQEQGAFAEKVAEAQDEYQAKQAAARDRTVIHKIALNNGDIRYVDQTEVPGSLLNQFSLDEENGYLRVATTTRLWARHLIQYNNVVVFDSSLKEVGRLENIAENESIYSTRFMGDKLYMVTFKRIDPLFVVDLSSPTTPKIIGELKIPGYSDYLHPYDATHVIGIGKETGTNEWGGTSTKGVKIALFDVSDVSNPRVVQSMEIGDAGSDSSVSQDHKAFLFDKEKQLMVIPIRKVTTRGTYVDNDDVWYGAYVFTITQDGFTERGQVQHGGGKGRWYWDWNAEVKRSLYIGDALYTLSGKELKVNDLADPSKQLATVVFPEQKQPGSIYYGRPSPGIAVEPVAVE